MENININELFTSIQKDNSLIANIDVDELLDSIPEDSNDLENKTLDDIVSENVEKLKEIKVENVEKIVDKLSGYKFIDDLYQLHKGKYIRWIKNNKLSNGGIVMDILFNDKGTNILCKNNMNRFFQLKFDDLVIFQKLSEEEQLLLMDYEYYKENN